MSALEVTLLESRGRLGGAAYSFQRDGLWVDNGQHVFLRCCTEYQRLVHELGADDLVTIQPRLDIAVLAPGGRRGRLRRSALPAPLHLAGSLARYPYLNLRQRLALTAAMTRLRFVDPDDPANDRRSFGEWLRRWRQDRRAIDAIWDLIVRPTINLTSDEASLAQAALVFRLGLLEQTDAGDIGHAVVPLGRSTTSPAARRWRGPASTCGSEPRRPRSCPTATASRSDWPAAMRCRPGT